VWLDLPRYLMRHPILRLPENQTGRGGDLGLIALAIPRRKLAVLRRLPGRPSWRARTGHLGRAHRRPTLYRFAASSMEAVRMMLVR
jgi:hypothetical protein